MWFSQGFKEGDFVLTERASKVVHQRRFQELAHLGVGHAILSAQFWPLSEIQLRSAYGFGRIGFACRGWNEVRARGRENGHAHLRDRDLHFHGCGAHAHRTFCF